MIQCKNIFQWIGLPLFHTGFNTYLVSLIIAYIAIGHPETAYFSDSTPFSRLYFFLTLDS